jgi:CBS domain-containing protein
MVEAYARHYPSKLRVGQYMTKKVITVEPDENLHMILLLMSDNQISRVIVTRDHKPIGILTGHDLLPVSILFGTGVAGVYWTSQEELVARGRAQRFIPAGIKAIFLARDMMKYDPITVVKDADLIEAAQLMTNNRISGLPVVEPNSESLAGIITKTDIVKGIASYRPVHDRVFDKIRNYFNFIASEMRKEGLDLTIKIISNKDYVTTIDHCRLRLGEFIQIKVLKNKITYKICPNQRNRKRTKGSEGQCKRSTYTKTKDDMVPTFLKAL